MQVHGRSVAHRRSAPIEVLGVTIAMALCQHAQAQETPASSARVQVLEEIVVTAQKREQRAIDVPISISSLDAESITARGATSLQDVQSSVPGLSIQSYGPGGSTFIQLRGVSNVVGRPTVGRYLDEMPINLEINAAGTETRLLDMERIEVLRGPQPTFYGDGSMGGTIRYVTAKPGLQALSGGLQADMSWLADGDAGWSAEGYIDIPIASERAGLRFAGAYEDRGGWIDRVPTGQKDINGVELSTLRGSFLGKLGDSAQLNVVWEHNSTDMDNQHFGVDRKTQLSVPTLNSSDSDIISSSLSVDIGFAELVLAPGYMKFENDQVFDLSPFYVPFLVAPPPFGFGFPPGFVTAIPLIGAYEADTFYSEVRLVSKGNERWNWAVGVDYKDASYDVESTTPTSPNPVPFVLLSSTIAQDNEVWAAWAEVGFDLTDRLSAGLGVRYFHDDTKNETHTVSFGVPTDIQGEDTFTSTNPRFNLSYKVNEDWNLYVNAAKGFRSGGFNGAQPDLPTYKPESLWSYEAGSKGYYFDRRLDFEAAVYYNDWKDVQANFYTPAGLTVTTNGGNIKGWGVDLSATVRPTNNLSFGATYGWNNMEYKEVPPNGDKALGDPPDLAVQLAWSAFVDYRRTLNGNSTMYGRADFQHSDDAQVTLRSPVFDTITELPARDLLNLRVGMTFGRYDVSLYANNALDEDAAIIRAPFGVLAEDVSQMPRHYGLTLRASF